MCSGDKWCVVVIGMCVVVIGMCVVVIGRCVVVSSRFIDASMNRDTCHAICIAIQFATIAIPAILQHSCIFYLNVSQT